MAMSTKERVEKSKKRHMNAGLKMIKMWVAPEDEAEARRLSAGLKATKKLLKSLNK